MRKILFAAVLSAFFIAVHAQRNANFGVFAGTSYYMGDINPNRHFYRPGASMGLIYRINLNKHYSIRANGYYTRLSGSDTDFSNIIHTDRYYQPVEFNTSLMDGTVQFEFNFLPFIPNSGKWDCVTYVAGGLGYSLILSSNVRTNLNAPYIKDPVSHMTVPFGAGIKINLSRRISAGGEWSFRKTFSDRIDFVQNPTGELSVVNNNDWYSYAGIFITYKFFKFAQDCPAYSE